MAAFGLLADCVTRSLRNHSLFALQYPFSRLHNFFRPTSPNCWGCEITHGTNPLDEWSALRRDLYLTTHNACQWQTYINPAGFELRCPSTQAATESRLRWRGHKFRHLSIYSPVTPTWALLKYALANKVTKWKLNSIGKVFPLQARCGPECVV